MSILGVGTSVRLAPALDLPKTQNRSVKQRAAIEQFAATLPGNGGQMDFKPTEFNNVASDLEQIGLTFDKKLQFIVDLQSNEVIVKVIDKETDKVIKVLPPEELQRLHRKLKETIGFLFDKRV
ncbi:MAG: flagellar protein FlaG [Treponema sp.]|jgi:flagellar protein FlaG|nr:flagellar protein FlaG [Treponema sp.]